MSLRFLFLHGYAQNGESFRNRTSSTRRDLKGLIGESVYLDGPYQCKNFVPEDPEEAKCRLGWWEFDVQEDGTRHRYGWETSVASLLSLLDSDEKGFDGVFGFSQGAVTAALLCAKRPKHFKMAILVAGGMPYEPNWKENLVAACSINKADLPPCLIVNGEADELWEPRAVADFVTVMGPAAVPYRHAGGHMVPSSKEFRDVLRAFVEDALSQQVGCDAVSSPIQRSSVCLASDELQSAVLSYIGTAKADP